MLYYASLSPTLAKPLRRSTMPHATSKRELRGKIQRLIKDAVKVFPDPTVDHRVHYKDITTTSWKGIRGKISVLVLPNSQSWDSLRVALRKDGVIEVVVDHYDPGHRPELGVHVTGRHTAPKRLRDMSREELEAALKLLEGLVKSLGRCAGARLYFLEPKRRRVRVGITWRHFAPRPTRFGY